MNTTDMNDTTMTNTTMNNIDILNKLHIAMIELYSVMLKEYNISVRYTAMPN